MDFFEAQEAARRKTVRLVVFYLIAIILIVFSLYAAVILILFFTGGQNKLPIEWWQPEIFTSTAVGVLIVVGA